MKDWPNPFWALTFMLLGCVLLLAVLVKVNSNTTTLMLGVLMAIATAGTSLISGAFGYINGHKDGVASASVPGASVSVGMDPIPSASEGPNATINPIQPGKIPDPQPATKK
jgi:hypothetical protein